MFSRYEPSRSISRSVALGAAAVAGAAIVTRFLTRRAEAKHVPDGKLLRIEGQTIHLIDEGSGPCVVLLHGNGSMVEDFEATTLIETLAKDYRVIALDRPGFGLSTRDTKGSWTPEREAEYLSHVLHHLDVRDAVIVGHSWGTLVAVAMALRDASSVAGLVLLSGYYYPTIRLDVALQTPSTLPVLGPILRHTILPLVGRLTAPLAMQQMFAPLKVPLLFSRLYSVPMATRPSQLKSVADDTVSMPASANRLAKHYSEIQLPVCIIAGDKDGIVTTSEQSERLNSELPNSQLKILQGVGHMTHHARPDLVVEAVRELTPRAAGCDFQVKDVRTADVRVS